MSGSYLDFQNFQPELENSYVSLICAERSFHNLTRKVRAGPQPVTRSRLAIKPKISTSSTSVPTIVLRPKNRDTLSIIPAQTMEIAIDKRSNLRNLFLPLVLHPSASTVVSTTLTASF